MGLSKQQNEGFAKFFEKPSREGLRNLIKNLNKLRITTVFSSGPKDRGHLEHEIQIARDITH
jgi:hypothetical protein